MVAGWGFSSPNSRHGILLLVKYRVHTSHWHGSPNKIDWVIQHIIQYYIIIIRCFSVNVVVQVNDRASYSDVTRVPSLLPGGPPLWLTQQGGSFFVSGAKIIMRNLEAYAGKRKQRLQIIDSVLEPLSPIVTDNSQAFIDLTGGKFLRESDAYRIPGYSIRYAQCTITIF